MTAASSTPPPLPSLDALYPQVAALRSAAPTLVADFEQALALGRTLRVEVLEPRALAVDEAASEDPTYVAEDVIREAARHRYYTLPVPKVFGGAGLRLGAFAAAIEEMSAGCVGLANLLTVHGLALVTLMSTEDTRRTERVCRRLVARERAGDPLLLSTALTEPGAGTDTEDRELVDTANLICEARPAPGGYRLDGRKVFISNGSIAGVHVVIAPTDRRRPAETSACFLVGADNPGVSVGRVEHKMGQKGCPATELVFEDCFIPEDDRLQTPPLYDRTVELLFATSRAYVGAFGAGVARGAFERAHAYASRTLHRGQPLIEQQWVQFRLTDMWRNAAMARSAVMEAILFNEAYGLASLNSQASLGDAIRKLPDWAIESAPMQSLVAWPRLRQGYLEAHRALPPEHVARSAALGAHAKVSGSDLAMANCELALDLMGADGLRHDMGMEKLRRDAKLLQIYEGTNQLNRIEVFKKGLAA